MIVRMPPEGRRISSLEALLSKEAVALIEVEAAQTVVVSILTEAEADLTVAEGDQNGVEVTVEEVVVGVGGISFESGQC